MLRPTPTRQVGGGGGGGGVTATTTATATATGATAIAAATASTATTLATEGHVLARLVWDLVASTAGSLLVTADDWDHPERDERDTESRCLCVRVSPLLSAVGEIQDRAPVCKYLWVDDTRSFVTVATKPSLLQAKKKKLDQVKKTRATMLTSSNEEKAMEFVMGGDNNNNPVLRARDQLGALASASSTTSGRRRRRAATANATADDEIATAATGTTLVLATEGHVVARMVWDLVASTARSLLVTVVGRDDWRNRAGDRSLCVRVSPLLLSVVGEIQDRAPAWSTLWVDDTRYLWDRFDSDDLSEVQSHSGGGVCAAVVQPRTKPVRKWRLYSDAGLGRRDDGVVVCEEPVGFIHECKAANSKWLVLLGRGESGGEKVLLVHRFDRCRNMIGEFSHYKVPLDLIADGDTLRGAPTPIRFDGQRPDELLLVVVRKSRSADTSIVASVIDVEQTHSNGTLCVLSTTSWPSPFACLTSTFVMRKKSGARCFICTQHISVPRTGTEYLDGCKMCGFAVEETTGHVTPLAPYTWFDPVNDSVFLIRAPLAEHNCLLICDCNDPTNPSKVMFRRNHSTATAVTTLMYMHSQDQCVLKRLRLTRLHTTSTTPLAAQALIIEQAYGCHIVARLVWDLVVSTARVFVFEVDGRDDAGEDEEECALTLRSCLCMRLSPLLLSVVGEIQDRVVVPRYTCVNRECLWVDDRSYLMAHSQLRGPDSGKPPVRWLLHRGGADCAPCGKREDDAVVVFEEPVWFRCQCQAANSKWMVLLGGGSGEKVLIVHQLGDNRVSRFSQHKVPLELLIDGDTPAGAFLRFNGPMSDELLLVVIRTSRLVDLSMRVIDVAQTNATGALCVLSATKSPTPRICHSVPFAMSKQIGDQCFIFTAATHDPGTGNTRGPVTVEELSAHKKGLAAFTHSSWFDPVSVSVFCIKDGAEQNNMLSCGCSNPTNHLKVEVSNRRYPSTDNNRLPLTVQSESEFLFCTTGSQITVIEPLTGFCYLTLQFPQCERITTALLYSS
ncbi:hypothetical protein Pelo_15613 [Pelomyxa schiedti]|nr:hypothetical protein Pelo_15613 [Pelomyxa schiedti]